MARDDHPAYPGSQKRLRGREVPEGFDVDPAEWMAREVAQYPKASLRVVRALAPFRVRTERSHQRKGSRKQLSDAGELPGTESVESDLDEVGAGAAGLLHLCPSVRDCACRQADDDRGSSGIHRSMIVSSTERPR